jgi:LmbE family N-acetylglucosaminyl deacetylase
MSEKKLHILGVGAHAADIELVAGGIIAKYVHAGHKATLLHLTPGEKGHPTLSAEEYGRQKIEEAEAAAKVLGADCRFLAYGDGELPLNEEVKWQVADVIRELKPDILFTHWKRSMHRDHERTHEIVKDARFYAALPAFRRELPAHGAWGMFYGDNWEDQYDYRIDGYVDISDVYDVYIDAINQFQLTSGAVSGFRYIDYYGSRAKMLGALAGFRYAQAFMLPEGAGVRKGQGLPNFEL